MIGHHSRLRLWLKKADLALGQDWERCDEETGRECRVIRCAIGAHRALVYLHRAIEEIDRSADMHDVLVAAIRIGLQEHEPYAGYKTTMLRQALEKAAGHRKG